MTDCVDGKNCGRCDPDTGSFENCVETVKGACACGKRSSTESCRNGPFIGCEPGPNGCSCEVSSMCSKADGKDCFACSDVETCKAVCSSKVGQCGLTRQVKTVYDFANPMSAKHSDSFTVVYLILLVILITFISYKLIGTLSDSSSFRLT